MMCEFSVSKVNYLHPFAFPQQLPLLLELEVFELEVFEDVSSFAASIFFADFFLPNIVFPPFFQGNLTL